MSARFSTSRHTGIDENPLAPAPACFRSDALRHDPTTQGRRRHAGQAKIQQQRFDDIVDADYDGASPLPHSEMSTKFGRSKSPGGSSPEMGDSWPPSSERLAAMHLRTRFGHPPSSVLRLIDTRRASPKWPLREVVCSRMPVRHYCGPIFLPHVANAIGGDDPHAGLQMGQGATTFVSGRLTAAMVGRGPQRATRYSTTLSHSTLFDDGRLRRPSRGRMPCWKDADEPAQTSCHL